MITLKSLKKSITARRLFSTKKPSDANGVPQGFAVSNVSMLRKVTGAGLAGLGLASFVFMEWDPHKILSPLQFHFKNNRTVWFPIKDKPHYQILTGRESMSLYMGGL